MSLNLDLLKSIEGKKRELDQFRPFPAEVVRKLNEQFTLEWTYNSSAIEAQRNRRLFMMSSLRD